MEMSAECAINMNSAHAKGGHSNYTGRGNHDTQGNERTMTNPEVMMQSARRLHVPNYIRR